MAEREVSWSAIFLAVFDVFFIGILKWVSLVTWKRGEDPDMRLSHVGKD